MTLTSVTENLGTILLGAVGSILGVFLIWVAVKTLQATKELLRQMNAPIVVHAADTFSLYLKITQFRLLTIGLGLLGLAMLIWSVWIKSLLPTNGQNPAERFDVIFGHGFATVGMLVFLTSVVLQIKLAKGISEHINDIKDADNAH
jgi:hypothetical protein